MSCHLHGLGVLVTRPAGQADRLCEMIEKAHGRPLRFPVMEIVPVEELRETAGILKRISATDVLIFVSVNAVEHAFPLLPDEIPLDLQIAAIGDATATRLEEYGLPVSLVPAGRFDSESLLELDALNDMQGKTVVIVRGQGGRELLRKSLEQRGAQVVYAEVYQRRIPRRNASNLLRGWESMVNAVTITSSGVLDNLLQMLGDQGLEKLAQTPLLVLSKRTAEYAKSLGCRHLILAAQAGDRGILEALCEYVET
jgi:uroporphyrinogen-III synthase